MFVAGGGADDFVWAIIWEAIVNHHSAAAVNTIEFPTKQIAERDALERICKSFGLDRRRVAKQDWPVVERLLSYAVETEKMLVEQQARIHYLETLSVTDELTGLLNRRGFNQAVDRTLAAAKRHQEKGLLAYLDLDNFKQINDLLGHDAGDQVLCHVAQVLTKNVRRTDYVARIGGDEFAVLFVRAQQLPTRAHALELRRALARTKLTIRDRSLTINASMGIQAYGPDTKASELLRRADQAMYLDKQHRQQALAVT